MALVRNSIETLIVDTTNFDVTADWGGLASVSDETSFISFLEGQGLMNVIVSDFTLTAGRLICYLSCDGTAISLSSIGVSDVNKVSGINGLEDLDLTGNQITDFNPLIALPNTLTQLNLAGNQIVTFDPSIPLPSGLLRLYIGANPIVTFNPSIALPSSLEELTIGDSFIEVFDPSIALPSSLKILEIAQCQIVDFNPSIPLPSGLEQLQLGGNQMVYFNPSIALPQSLVSLSLITNQMNIAGYAISETWAILQPSFTSNCTINFTANINSVSGTNLETILLTKNTTIIS